MENYTNDISSLALLFILFKIVASAFIYLLVIVVTFFIAKALIPFTANNLGIHTLINGRSKYDAAAFMISWLFIGFILIGIIQGIMMAFHYSLYEFISSIGYVDIYLIPFAFFTFDKDLHVVILKPFKKILVIALLYFGMSFLLNRSNLNMVGELPDYMWWAMMILDPLLTLVVTIAILKRSLIVQQAEPLKFVP